MTINFYMNNEEETPIFNLYDAPSNPFSVGDVILLDVEMIFPTDFKGKNEERSMELLQNHKDVREMFDRKKVKIVREGKYVRFNIIGEPKLTIEYHCEFVK